MASEKIAITIREELLREVDRWVARGEFPNRSQALQAGLQSLREARARRRRFLRELGKLNRREMVRLAEERLEAEAPWPAY